MKTGDILINTQCDKFLNSGKPNPAYCMIFLKRDFEYLVCLRWDGKFLKIFNSDQFIVKGHVDLFELMAKDIFEKEK